MAESKYLHLQRPLPSSAPAAPPNPAASTHKTRRVRQSQSRPWEEAARPGVCVTSTSQTRLSLDPLLTPTIPSQRRVWQRWDPAPAPARHGARGDAGLCAALQPRPRLPQPQPRPWHSPCPGTATGDSGSPVIRVLRCRSRTGLQRCLSGTGLPQLVYRSGHQTGGPKHSSSSQERPPESFPSCFPKNAFCQIFCEFYF